MNEAILLLGGNLGNRELVLKEALEKIEELIGQIIAVSSFYESEPWGFEHENLFLNQAIKVNTALSPQLLIEVILEIEKKLGRIRTGSITARVIDIDILFYGNETIETETLSIPHPRIAERLFTLLPLQEIYKANPLPVLNKTADNLIAECSDNSKISRYLQHA